MKRFLFIIIFLVAIWLAAAYLSRPASLSISGSAVDRSFAFQSIDTMKYSRDMARSKLHSTSFDAVIEQQIDQIAATGATHVAIATPYDEEFMPMLQRWVDAARRHHLQVWFRGNWSGWEGWFDYPTMTRAQHEAKTKQFILDHAALFADGDVFTACPECENGAAGDPRHNGDVVGFRRFMIDEYKATSAAFQQIGKQVTTNYASMNADVARLVMDTATTKAMDGVVTIDHYVKTPDQLDQDITDIAAASGGRVVLGEWGTPVPDINGGQTDDVQRTWINDVLQRLTKNPHLLGMNYWVNVGGSTALWRSDGSARPAMSIIRDWFHPRVVVGVVHDGAGRRLAGVHLATSYGTDVTDAHGQFVLPLSVQGDTQLHTQMDGYTTSDIQVAATTTTLNITLTPQHQTLAYRLRHLWYGLSPWK